MLIQLPQFGSGFNGELVNQVRARPQADLKRLGLPSAPVIGKGKPGLDVLAERMLVCQLPKFRNHMMFLAEEELSINAARKKLEPQLIETGADGPAQRGRRNVFQRHAAP
jgi:hypothetical protein